MFVRDITRLTDEVAFKIITNQRLRSQYKMRPQPLIFSRKSSIPVPLIIQSIRQTPLYIIQKGRSEMFTYTTSRKKLLRMIIIILAVLTVAAIIFMSVAKGFKVAAAEKKVPIYAVSRADNRIALTFDCAWGNSNTDLLLSLLKEAGAPATFFVTGEFCDKYPDDVKKIYDAGHEIGNHSDIHPHVEGININDLISDTRECSRKIKMITGSEPKIYRAPYGEYDDNVVSTIEGMGLKMIQWSVDSIDWQEPDADTITERVVSKTESGSILLFHNDLQNTSQALPDVLSKLKQKGFTFSKVSDLVYYDSYHIDSSGIQVYDASALLPTARYSDNYLLDEAMEILRLNLSLQEIYDLTGGANPQLLQRTAPLLDKAHLAAVQEASFEELKEAVENLVIAAERYGAGENIYSTTAYPDYSAPSETNADYSSNNGYNSDYGSIEERGTGVIDDSMFEENSGTTTDSSSSGAPSKPPVGSITTPGFWNDIKAGQPVITTTTAATTTVPPATSAQTTTTPPQTTTATQTTTTPQTTTSPQTTTPPQTSTATAAWTREVVK